jgi:hypothetical protein
MMDKRPAREHAIQMPGNRRANSLPARHDLQYHGPEAKCTATRPELPGLPDLNIRPI